MPARHPLARTCGAILAAATLALPSCRGSSSAESPGVVVDPNGGDLAAQGATLSLPANALTAPVTVRMVRATPPNLSGFRAIGAAIALTPAGQRLEAAATLTLPFSTGDQGLLGVDLDTDLLVLQTDAQGRLHVRLPSSIDLNTGRCTASIDRFGTCWIAARPANLPVDLADYFPADGSYFQFDSATMGTGSREGDPNTDQVGLRGLQWTQMYGVPESGAAGIYYRTGPTGGVEVHGWFDEGLEQLLGTPPLQLPPSLLEGESFAIATDDEWFEPFGAALPRLLAGALRVDFGPRQFVVGLHEVYGDCLPMTVTFLAGGATFRQLRFDLARGVGPVRFSDGVRTYQLLSAVVDGQVIP